MQRPLVPIALAFMAGIGLAHAVPIPFVAAAVIALAAAATAFTRAGTILALPALALACTSAGIARGRLNLDLVGPADLRRLTPAEPQIAAITGTLLESPVLRETVRGDRTTLRTMARLDVDSMERDGRAFPARGRVQVSHRGQFQGPFHAGRRVRIEGVLQQPRDAAAPGLFDYRDYLSHQGIFRQLLTDQPADWTSLDPVDRRPPLSARFVPWAQEILARGVPRDESTRLVWAMALGWKTALNETVEEPFMRSGTMHVFAISGLHIALIAMMLVGVLRLLRVPRSLCGPGVVPLVWMYVLATGWQASAVRSAIMTTVIAAGWSLRRPSDLLNSLAGAALWILADSPGELFLPGFQMSFAAVAGLAVVAPPIRQRLELGLVGQRWIPERELSTWQRVSFRLRERLPGPLATALAAWLVTLPFTVHYFNIANPVAIAANLLIVPLSSGVLAASALSLATTPLWEWGGTAFNASAWAGMTLMVQLSQWFAALPGGHWRVTAPPPAWWIPYAVALVLPATGWPTAGHRWKVAAAALATAAAAVLTALQHQAGGRWTLLQDSRSITYEPPHGGGVELFNPGSTAEFGRVRDWLQTRGVDRLERAWTLSPDVRHAAATPLLASDLPIDRLLLPAGRTRSTALRTLEELASNRRIRLDKVAAGTNAGPWRILHPPLDESGGNRLAERALVLLGGCHDCSILLIGPLNTATQISLAESLKDTGPVDVIFAESTDAGTLPDGLLEVLQPRCVVVAATRTPVSTRLPAAEKARLRAHPWPTFFTDDDGTVTVRVDATALRVRTGERWQRIPERAPAGARVP